MNRVVWIHLHDVPGDADEEACVLLGEQRTALMVPLGAMDRVVGLLRESPPAVPCCPSCGADGPAMLGARPA